MKQLEFGDKVTVLRSSNPWLKRTAEMIGGTFTVNAVFSGRNTGIVRLYDPRSKQSYNFYTSDPKAKGQSLTHVRLIKELEPGQQLLPEPRCSK